MGKYFKSADEFLDKEELSELQRFFENNVAWEFGSQSDRWKLPFGHWNRDFLNADPRNQSSYEDQLFTNSNLKVVAAVWRKIKTSIFVGDELVRCYANAHTYGVEGYPHVDHRLPGNRTTLIYLNPVWTPEWAGETVLINEIDDVVHASLPKPGRVLAFDGRITHAARSVSRRCPALRVVLVYKSKKQNAIEMDIPEKCDKFLKQSKASHLAHSEDYSLFDHLIGTYQTLKEYGASDYVCMAGLFHSIYGTSIFNEKTLQHSERSQIKDIIGEKAEELVYVFSMIDRPKSFENCLGEDNFNWAKNLEFSFDKMQACSDLLTIECANILEQKGFAKYPKLAQYARKIGMLNDLLL